MSGCPIERVSVAKTEETKGGADMTYHVDGLCLPVEFLVMGPIENNVYFIGGQDEQTGADAGALIVVDPTCQADVILQALGDRVPDAIVLTHCHWDHVGAAAELREATGAMVVAGAIDAPVITGEQVLEPAHTPFEPCPVDHVVNHGDILKIGSMPWKVLHTPGHTPGGICLYIDPRFGTNPQGLPICVSGDTLFCGSIGRTDFAGGSMEQMRASLKRLAALPDNTAVLPGHNSLTTIGAERQRVFAYFA